MFSIAFGGQSSERHVSYSSLQYVLDQAAANNALNEIQYFIYVLENGKVRVIRYKKSMFGRRDWDVNKILKRPYVEYDSMSAFALSKHAKAVGTVYSILYGEYGEDGKYTTIFDLAGIPVTTNSPVVDALLMDKRYTAKLLEGKKLKPIPTYFISHKSRSVDIDMALKAIKELGYDRVVVKPNDLGASLGGCCLPTDNSNVVKQTVSALLPASWTGCLIQPFIKGQELCVSFGIAPNLELRAFAVNEVLIGGKTGVFNSFDAKHGDTRRRKEINFLYTASYGFTVPPEFEDLIDASTQFIKQVGVEMPCRMDVIRTPEQDYLLEVNTIPGISSKSIFPMGLNQTDSPVSPFKGQYWGQLQRMLKVAKNRTNKFYNKKRLSTIEDKANEG